MRSVWLQQVSPSTLACVKIKGRPTAHYCSSSCDVKQQSFFLRVIRKEPRSSSARELLTAIPPLRTGASLWAESEPGKGDFHPFEVSQYGTAVLFWGNQVSFTPSRMVCATEEPV